MLNSLHILEFCRESVKEFLPLMECEVSLSYSEDLLVYSEPDEASLDTISLRFILILFCYVLIGLNIGVFPLVFANKILYVFLISSIRVTYLTHLMFLGLITWIMFSEQYTLWSFLFFMFSASPLSVSFR
jgi:hypothetical protein